MSVVRNRGVKSVSVTGVGEGVSFPLPVSEGKEEKTSAIEPAIDLLHFEPFREHCTRIALDVDCDSNCKFCQDDMDFEELEDDMDAMNLEDR